jgi:hypothetical protein
MSNILNLIDIFESYPYNTLVSIVSNAAAAINVKEYNNNYKISVTKCQKVLPNSLKSKLNNHHPK